MNIFAWTNVLLFTAIYRIILFACCTFNDAISVWDCVGSNDAKMIEKKRQTRNEVINLVIPGNLAEVRSCQT
jgi:hypothetical protein